MALVRFTANIQRHVACPERTVEGVTVAETLEAYFRENDAARGYVLDDQGNLRTHMVVFVDGQHIRDRATLSDPVGADGVVDVMQALSGG